MGDREALKLLRQLIDMALESDTAGGEVFTRDGEGYHVLVIRASDEAWNKVTLPYTDEMARGQDSDKEWPPDF
jgi:hypothetical protein